MKHKETPLRVVRGAIKVGKRGYVIARHARIAAVFIPTKSKHPGVFTFGGNSVPNVWLTDEGSTDINEKLRGKVTEARLPDFAGWDVWATATERYGVNVCLMKRK